MKSQKRRPVFILASVLAVIGFIFASTLAGAASVTPVLVSGNPSCASLNADDANFPTITSDYGFKVNNAPTGTFPFDESNGGELTGGALSDPGNSVTISNVETTDLGQIFDWAATLGIDAVIVKGGDNANVYVYDPEATSDQDLHAPVNPENNQYFGISHIEFCYDYEVATDTPTPTETNTPTDTPTNTPTDTPTNTPTDTPTNTPTDTPTNTPTDTPTNTPTDTPTNTPTDTPTNTPTDTPTNTPTDTPTNTPTDTPTNTPTDTPTNTPTDTPTNTPTNTPTKTPLAENGHLKICKIADHGVQNGQVFTITVNGTKYQVKAGFCIYAGKFPLRTQVTVQEEIPAGHFVSGLFVIPGDRAMNLDKSQGKAIVKIGSGYTFVVFKNSAKPTGKPALSLEKTANPTTYSAVGQVIVYTYKVRNTGNVPLTGPFMITDNKLGTFQCGTATSLAPGASITCTKNYTIKASDISTVTGVTNLPNGLPAIVTYGTWMQGSWSIMNVNLSGLDPASGLPNGKYAGWCIQDHITGQLKNQTAKLYSSIGSGLPADAANLPWNKINYVLNHKIRGAGKTDLQFHQDVQTAIWLLLGEPNPDWGISSQAQQMVNAANANPNYVPGNADVVAVLVYSDGMGTANPNISKQETIIEVTKRSITNKATATGLFGTVTVTSNQAQATIKQVAP